MVGIANSKRRTAYPQGTLDKARWKDFTKKGHSQLYELARRLSERSMHPSFTRRARLSIGQVQQILGKRAKMADIRKVTDGFAVAPQISEKDLEEIAAAGYKTVIANRPDGEGGPLQPSMGAIRAKAESLGLAFFALPFSGAPTPDIAARQAELIAQAPQPVLAYCRTGTRSITAWALSQAGEGNADNVISAGQEAGYDLSGLRSHL